MKFGSVKAIVFDAYGTLFDVHSVIEACHEAFPDKGDKISQIWRQKQLEYSFLRSLMGRYRPFIEVTRDALRFACENLGLTLDSGKEAALMKAYLELKPYDEIHDVLPQLTEKKLAIFTNGSHDMIDPLIEKYKFTDSLDEVISADHVKQYKPTPASYTYVLDRLPVQREEVLFLSSNTWDISGAANFGFHTAWVNRSDGTMDELGFQPDAVIHDLTELPKLV
jgi:2-haloacid dehalogenase